MVTAKSLITLRAGCGAGCVPSYGGGDAYGSSPLKVRSIDLLFGNTASKVVDMNTGPIASDDRVWSQGDAALAWGASGSEVSHLREAEGTSGAAARTGNWQPVPRAGSAKKSALSVSIEVTCE